MRERETDTFMKVIVTDTVILVILEHMLFNSQKPIYYEIAVKNTLQNATSTTTKSTLVDKDNFSTKKNTYAIIQN